MRGVETGELCLIGPITRAHPSLYSRVTVLECRASVEPELVNERWAPLSRSRARASGGREKTDQDFDAHMMGWYSSLSLGPPGHRQVRPCPLHLVIALTVEAGRAGEEIGPGTRPAGSGLRSSVAVVPCSAHSHHMGSGAKDVRARRIETRDR
jgi:hypothetical protein